MGPKKVRVGTTENAYEWTTLKVQDLIHCVEESPILFQTTHVDYHNVHLKNQKFDEISKRIGCSGKLNYSINYIISSTYTLNYIVGVGIS
jgi:hypothetical protein